MLQDLSPCLKYALGRINLYLDFLFTNLKLLLEVTNLEVRLAYAEFFDNSQPLYAYKKRTSVIIIRDTFIQLSYDLFEQSSRVVKIPVSSYEKNIEL